MIVLFYRVNTEVSFRKFFIRLNWISQWTLTKKMTFVFKYWLVMSEKNVSIIVIIVYTVVNGAVKIKASINFRLVVRRDRSIVVKKKFETSGIIRLTYRRFSVICISYRGQAKWMQRRWENLWSAKHIIYLSW